MLDKVLNLKRGFNRVQAEFDDKTGTAARDDPRLKHPHYTELS